MVHAADPKISKVLKTSVSNVSVAGFKLVSPGPHLAFAMVEYLITSEIRVFRTRDMCKTGSV